MADRSRDNQTTSGEGSRPRRRRKHRRRSSNTVLADLAAREKRSAERSRSEPSAPTAEDSRPPRDARTSRDPHPARLILEQLSVLSNLGQNNPKPAAKSPETRQTSPGTGTARRRRRRRFTFPWERWNLPEIDPERRQGIRRRWLMNSVGSLLAVAIVLLIFVSTVFINYCYTGMRSGLNAQAQSASDFISSYATSESAYLEMANYYIYDFPYQDTLELQFINPSGVMLLSSYGLTSGSRPSTEDITLATTSLETSNWVGRNPETGERIMAVSSPIVVGGEVKGIIRLVTSLSLVDKEVLMFICMAFLVSSGIIALVYITNLYLIKSIVEPMASVTDTAKHIAAGSYGIQIEKRYQDEVGDLIDAINDMSQRINQNEKMKSEFISSVSHELRTPLTAINGWSETLLAGEISDPESVRKGLSIIASEGKRLSKMVEELLEFSRIEDGRFTLNIEPIDIQAELEDAIFTYRQFYRKKNIELDYRDTAGELPLIPGDPERLRQVFSNVLDNAAKHGGENQSIQVMIARSETMVLIGIRDHGPGVPEKDLPHVKEKFYKGSSKARGNGIGLAVCDEIVGRLGGELTIGNAEGGGCIVTISLPIAAPKAEGTK